LNSQPQRARGDLNFFQLEYTVRIGLLVESRDTGKFGNASLNSSSRFPPSFSDKVCNAGDVAAGTGKAFNVACRDRIASERVESVAGSDGDRYPSRGTFFGCCASAMTANPSSITATRIDGVAAFFIAHLVSSVIYHADRDKGKCDLHSGRRRVLVEWEGQNQLEIKLYGSVGIRRNIGSLENSI
jgi:hypothetical protein